LGTFYKYIDRRLEFRALLDKCLYFVGQDSTSAKRLGVEAFDLWLYIKAMNAEELLYFNDLDAAARSYQEILDEIINLNDSLLAMNIASCYNSLGNISEKLREFDRAIDYHKQAIKTS
jgi:tetratricopeptide (TPR) repeat protein